MENVLVKDLMVPISEYATVEVGTPLIDAIRALEQAQEAYTESKYQHRAVMVLDKSGNVVGKISQLRALEAIEPEFDFLDHIEDIKKFKFSEDYISDLREIYRTQGQIINKQSLQAASQKKVEEFMQAHSAGEYVAEESDLDAAIHKLVSGRHLSLLVSREDKIVGILRISDVFAAVFSQVTAIEV
ncbi:MAG: CBS domain-containing protein [Desulfobulbaceae bacterium]|nr:CBS domain-containing protein [Desulfobulbaceae bacterium]